VILFKKERSFSQYILFNVSKQMLKYTLIYGHFSKLSRPNLLGLFKIIKILYSKNAEQAFK